MTGGSSIPEPPEKPRIKACAPEAKSHSRSKDGKWHALPVSSAPVYIFSTHVHENLQNPDHFFISVRLHFPNRKSVCTFALLDCGATASCISLDFANHHSLPRRLKDEPVPVTAVDNRPISSGLVTHEVITSLSIHSHLEVIALGIVCVPFPIILGLDWLR